MKRSRSPLLLFLAAFFLTLAVGGYFLFKDTAPPELTVTPEAKTVYPGQKFTITATDRDSAIRSITVSIRKKSQVQLLAREIFSGKETSRTIMVPLKNTGLRDGAFTLIVNAVDSSFAGFGQGNSVTREFAMTMDTTPPKITVKTAYPYVRRGGAGVISYTLSREVEKTGVMVKDWFFPAFRQDNGEYVCFFAFPYYMTGQEYLPDVVMIDADDNKHAMRLPLYRVNQVFKTDTVRVNDRFLELKMPEFESQVPGTTSYLELFNKVNGELRKSNEATLREIGQTSSPVALWHDAFMALPSGAVKAGFAEHRSYIYNDKKQDVESTHLGLDLASLARSPVPAGNAGVVVFTGYLGIYGNLVIIDHGLGLQSLYSHLSEISVTKGQSVARGEILGRTGVTGMAVGDHLHFGILISGLEVSPIEWLDRKWIKDNVTDRLEDAGMHVITLQEAKADVAAEQAPETAPAQKQAGPKQSSAQPKKAAGKPAQKSAR